MTGETKKRVAEIRERNKKGGEIFSYSSAAFLLDLVEKQQGEIKRLQKYTKLSMRISRESEEKFKVLLEAAKLNAKNRYQLIYDNDDCICTECGKLGGVFSHKKHCSVGKLEQAIKDIDQQKKPSLPMLGDDDDDPTALPPYKKDRQ